MYINPSGNGGGSQDTSILKQKLDELTESLSTIETTVTNSENNFRTLTDTVETLNTKFDRAGVEEIPTIKVSISSLDTNIKDLTGRVETLESAQTN